MELEPLQRRAETLFAGMLGIRFTSAEADRVTAEMLVRDELCTTPGIGHGGALMAFADTLGGTATAINLPAGAGTTTIESKTNFIAAAHAGETVRGECNALHRGKRTMVWQTRITSEDGRTLALVTQTQIVLEARQTAQQTLSSLFQGKSTSEQKALLAQLERAGAALYDAFAAAEQDPSTRDALKAASKREVENAELLEDA